MGDDYQVIIVGAGQAGLSVAYYLKRKKIRFLILEKNEIAHSWRHQRWDDLCLVTPNWQLQLPGYHYTGSEPNGFLKKEEILNYLNDYAASINPPILQNTTVVSVKQDENLKYEVQTNDHAYYSDNVIVCTGTHQFQNLPEVGRNICKEVRQLPSGEFKNADLLPNGNVLVVGSGQSGSQIAKIVSSSHRKVFLSVGDAPMIVRRYRGRDITAWMSEMGEYHLPITDHIYGKDVRYKTHPHMSGCDGGHTVDLLEMEKEGVTLCGTVASTSSEHVYFNDDLTFNLTAAREFCRNKLSIIDDWILKSKIIAETENPLEDNGIFPHTLSNINLVENNISTIIWSIGFKMDLSWIKLDVLDDRGYPIQQRGITNFSGLYFVGLHWMHTMSSGLFYGVGNDAKHIVDHIMESDSA